MTITASSAIVLVASWITYLLRLYLLRYRVPVSWMYYYMPTDRQMVRIWLAHKLSPLPDQTEVQLSHASNRFPVHIFYIALSHCISVCNSFLRCPVISPFWACRLACHFVVQHRLLPQFLPHLPFYRVMISILSQFPALACSLFSSKQLLPSNFDRSQILGLWSRYSLSPSFTTMPAGLFTLLRYCLLIGFGYQVKSANNWGEVCLSLYSVMGVTHYTHKIPLLRRQPWAVDCRRKKSQKLNNSENAREQ